ncbi:UDP-N-acetylmuramoyl-L-alanine--D-glutamate ligase [Rugosimonospora acidiphila]|uniref:UDP-N-acetylmuramoylalanine--D-glutamate ligase n=1 Tax=Rugosimonospora acidiphila TaxID=556531 RepID=A0ABP9SKK5_9ACTN
MSRVLVGGAGVAGVAAARALLARGATVTVVAAAPSPGADELAASGVRVVIADPAPLELLDEADELVVSPGFAPHHPLVTAAADRGLEVYSEPELAWRLRGPGAPAWLGITGTNGKTTTTTMLAAILTAAGRSTAALGNIGEPLVYTSDPDGRYEVLAVELSSAQLHWSRDLAPQAGALLNLADDHLDWHGSFEAYARAKEAVWRAATPERGGVAVGNLDDVRVAKALARVTGRTIGFTLGDPAAGQLGVRDGWLYDEAFGAGRLIETRAIRPPGAHNVSNALAAAALALSYGVDSAAVRDGLAGYRPEPHRNAYVDTVSGVDYVDDSKATNPHAAYASLTAYPRIVWVAGGQLKGVDVSDLVASVADRLTGAVLLGVDRAEVAQALARHAPRVPVVDVASVDDGAMAEAVRAATELARPGDTVLLAPAAASLDMYASYARRGDAFAAAVRDLVTQTGEPIEDRELERHGGGRQAT